ncbi:MAG TPA: molybdenum cofactor biosynthesis protein MoaE [Chitinophagaceae bacterium]|nr:molybdenum cofactor biosynthesis protein MoaE [Chitinophagaceae bacterium]
MLLKIVEHIDIAEAYNYLQHPSCGAVNLFIGTVRDRSRGKEVTKLVFEAYETMALKEFEKIALLAKQQWPLERITVIHATGEKLPGDAVVAVGVASPHRQAVFEATAFIMQELKTTVPIWKHEYYGDESVWINAHP